jgi:hypothetical protein
MLRRYRGHIPAAMSRGPAEAKTSPTSDSNGSIARPKCHGIAISLDLKTRQIFYRMVSHVD